MGFSDLSARASGRTLSVSLRTNAATLGWEIYDAASMVLLSDGCADGAKAIAIPVPEGDGDFRVFLFEPFHRGTLITLNARAVGDTVECTEPRVTSRFALRVRALLRAIPKAFAYPVRTIAENRALIATMVRRDISARYKGSFIGLFWTVLNPLLLTLTYFFVFGVVMKARFGADTSKHGFVLYFLAGILPWLAFVEAAGRGPNTILENRVLVKKLVFPLDILNVVQTLAGLTNQVIGLGIFLLYLWIVRGAIPATGLWLPVLLIPQLLFTVGVAWFLAALGVYVRDLAQIIGLLLTLWFYVTPICYPESALPAAMLPVLSNNPIFLLVRAWRTIFLEGRPPDVTAVVILWIVGIVCAAAGYAWFHRLRKGFADVL